VPSPEEIGERWDGITSLEDAEYYNDMNEMFGKLMASMSGEG